MRMDLPLCSGKSILTPSAKEWTSTSQWQIHSRPIFTVQCQTQYNIGGPILLSDRRAVYFIWKVWNPIYPNPAHEPIPTYIIHQTPCSLLREIGCLKLQTNRETPCMMLPWSLVMYQPPFTKQWRPAAAHEIMILMSNVHLMSHFWKRNRVKIMRGSFPRVDTALIQDYLARAIGYSLMSHDWEWNSKRRMPLNFKNSSRLQTVVFHFTMGTRRSRTLRCFGWWQEPRYAR